MNTLTATGTAVLLVYGAKLHPPRLSRGPGDPGRPGIEVTADDHKVTLEAVGYSCHGEGVRAIRAATQTCLAAGLHVSFTGRPLTREVRRNHA